MRPVAVLLAVTVLLAGFVRAADPPPEPDATAARAAVTASFAAAGKGDWAAYVKGFRPESVKAFRDALAPSLGAAAKLGPDQQAAWLTLFPGAKDVKAVLAYTPEEFLAALMKGASTTVADGKPITETAVALGVVPEGPDQAHAVARVTRHWLGVRKSGVEVVTVRKVGGAWKLDLPPELEVLAAALKASGNGQTEQRTEAVAPDAPEKK